VTSRESTRVRLRSQKRITRRTFAPYLTSSAVLYAARLTEMYWFSRIRSEYSPRSFERFLFFSFRETKDKELMALAVL